MFYHEQIYLFIQIDLLLAAEYVLRLDDRTFFFDVTEKKIIFKIMDG